jgi:hypothetical protein
MTSVVFVHGIGTREPDYTNTFNLIERKLHEMLPQLKAVRCYWGDIGARLHQDGASIPLYDSTRATGALERRRLRNCALGATLSRPSL